MLDHRGTKLGQPAPDPRGQLNGVGLALGRGHFRELVRDRAADIDLAAVVSGG
jgi:hypothetical protein